MAKNKKAKSKDNALESASSPVVEKDTVDTEKGTGKGTETVVSTEVPDKDIQFPSQTPSEIVSGEIQGYADGEETPIAKAARLAKLNKPIKSFFGAEFNPYRRQDSNLPTPATEGVQEIQTPNQVEYGRSMLSPTAGLPKIGDVKAEYNPSVDPVIKQPIQANKDLTPKAEQAQTQQPQGDNAMQSWLDWLSEQKRQQAELIRDDEQRQRSEQSRRKIAAIADGLSAVANMIGVSHGGYNIPGVGGMYGIVDEGIRSDQKMRRAKIDSNRSAINTAYNQYFLQKNREKANTIQEDREGRLRTKDENTNKIKWANLGLNRDKLDEKIREFDLNFNGLSESEKEKARQKALDRLSDKEIAQIRSNASISVAQIRAEAAKYSADHRAQGGTKKPYNAEYENRLAQLAGDWSKTIEDFVKETGKTEDVRLIRLETDPKKRIENIRLLVAANPEWAKKHGIDPLVGQDKVNDGVDIDAAYADNDSYSEYK